MKIDEHKQQFDNLYQNIPVKAAQITMDFPLGDIDKYDWQRGKYCNTYYNYFYRRFSSHILSKLSLNDNQNILVVGCGLGDDEKNIHYLFKTIGLWSFDISNIMVMNALKNNTPSNLFLGIAERIPFPDNSFDRVLSREVIEHVMKPQEMICEINRVLKPGGIAEITTENSASLSLGNFYDRYIRKPLAKLMRYSLPSSAVKDDAPSVEEMKTFASNAGILLKEIIYDGALYKIIYKFSFIFRNKTPFVAHYLSCLENSFITGKAFCDQVKFVFIKDAHTAPTNTINERIEFICIKCNGNLSLLDNQYKCSRCSQIFPLNDGIPNFIPNNIEFGPEPQMQTDLDLPTKSIGKTIANIIFNVLNKSIMLLYIGIYLLLAFTCTLFVKKNKNRMSSVLSENDPYRKYITII